MKKTSKSNSVKYIALLAFAILLASWYGYRKMVASPEINLITEDGGGYPSFETRLIKEWTFESSSELGKKAWRAFYTNPALPVLENGSVKWEKVKTNAVFGNENMEFILRQKVAEENFVVQVLLNPKETRKLENGEMELAEPRDFLVKTSLRSVKSKQVYDDKAKNNIREISEWITTGYQNVTIKTNSGLQMAEFEFKAPIRRNLRGIKFTFDVMDQKKKKELKRESTEVTLTIDNPKIIARKANVDVGQAGVAPASADLEISE